MESIVKQRIKLFIEYKKISIREFERSCGLSNGYINGITQTIMPNKLSDISQRYPDLNAGRLLTGEGEMLREISGHLDNHQITMLRLTKLLNCILIRTSLK